MTWLSHRPQRRRKTTVTLAALSLAARRGLLRLGIPNLPCALGRGGRRASKREGDGATPLGSFRLLGVLYRPDRVGRPRTVLPVHPIRPDDGWCDAPGDRNYNRAVRLPYPASAERLWREDRLYDIVIVTDHNTRPRIRGHGSAIFLHIARPDLAPTEGCIALRREHLLLLLGMIRGGTTLRACDQKRNARSRSTGRSVSAYREVARSKVRRA